MSKQKLADQIYKYLVDAGFKNDTPESFRKLYAHVESGKPISSYLKKKFTLLGFYHPKENQIENPEDLMGLIMQALTFDGMVQAKCPDGKIHSLQKYKQALKNKSKQTSKESGNP